MSYFPSKIVNDNSFSASAVLYSKRLLLLGPIIGVFMGIILALFAKPILTLYNVSPDVKDTTIKIIYAISALMPIRIFNLILIIGVLRGGGDTKVTLLMDAIGVWAIGVPLAFLGGLVWGLPTYVVYILISLEEAFKFFFGVFRFKSRKWLNNLVTH